MTLNVADFDAETLALMGTWARESADATPHAPWAGFLVAFADQLDGGLAS